VKGTQHFFIFLIISIKYNHFKILLSDNLR